jgi:tetratricopeptide (TPR) repeat protein
LYISVFAALCAAAATASPQTRPDPDALYRDRENLASARQAASIWEARLKEDPRDFESTWKLARAYYWLGGHGSQAERRRDLERGVTAGEQAILVEKDRPEGYFWKAANMGALAESFGLRQGIRYRGAIKDALLTVLRIDPAYQQGSADRALGRWYDKVPGLFGGSKQKAEEHLRKSLTYNANSHASRFFLAETLFEMDRDAEAIEELKKVIAAPLTPGWEPEDREFKKKAEDLLANRSRPPQARRYSRMPTRIIGSNSRVPLQAGQRLGLESLSSPNTKSHALQRAGIT